MDKVSEGRKREARPIDSSMNLNISRGAGKMETMSLHHLKEEERKTEEWKLMEKGGVRVIPVTEFRLKHTKNVGKVSKKKTDIDSYGMELPDSVIEEEITATWKNLIEPQPQGQGKSERAAITEIKKMPLY